MKLEELKKKLRNIDKELFDEDNPIPREAALAALCNELFMIAKVYRKELIEWCGKGYLEESEERLLKGTGNGR